MPATFTEKATRKLVRIELLRRGWTTKDFARRLGVDFRHLSNVICGNSRSPVMRAKITHALGKNLWPDSSEQPADPQPEPVSA